VPGVLRRDAAADVKFPAETRRLRFRGIVVTGAEHDDMPAGKPVALVYGCEMRGERSVRSSSPVLRAWCRQGAADDLLTCLRASLCRGGISWFPCVLELTAEEKDRGERRSLQRNLHRELLSLAALDTSCRIILRSTVCYTLRRRGYAHQEPHALCVAIGIVGCSQPQLNVRSDRHLSGRRPR